MADVSLRLDVKGIPELLRTLKDLRVDFEESVAAAMVASAFVVSNDAKRRAPRKTGNLARSITPGVGTDPKGSTGPILQTAGVLPTQNVDTLKGDLKKDGKATAWIATNVVYAPAQEFDHAHPFLRPALDENTRKVQETYATALKQVIQKARR